MFYHECKASEVDNEENNKAVKKKAKDVDDKVKELKKKNSNLKIYYITKSDCEKDKAILFCLLSESHRIDTNKLEEIDVTFSIKNAVKKKEKVIVYNIFMENSSNRYSVNVYKKI